MLPRVCSVIDHRWRQNVVRTKVVHEAIAESDTVKYNMSNVANQTFDIRDWTLVDLH